MKYAAAALGAFAGLASASPFAIYPRNATYPAQPPPTAGSSTTLTVDVTQTTTITACASTVTNCPASTGPAVVTQVVDLTTTVCPVADASSIHNSVVGAHSSGLITGTTHDVSPTEVPSTGVVDQTLTMTVGPKSSQTVLTTTVHSTFTNMVTVTMTKDNGAEAEATPEPTTTTTSTSTGTRTVTVTPYPTAGEGSGNGGSGSGSGDDSCDCPLTQATVTVTEPAKTVYITAFPTADMSTFLPTTTDSPDSPSDAEPLTTFPPLEVPPPASSATQSTVVPVPYPTGAPPNGTVPYPTGR